MPFGSRTRSLQATLRKSEDQILYQGLPQKATECALLDAGSAQGHDLVYFSGERVAAFASHPIIRPARLRIQYTLAFIQRTRTWLTRWVRVPKARLRVAQFLCLRAVAVVHFPYRLTRTATNHRIAGVRISDVSAGILAGVLASQIRCEAMQRKPYIWSPAESTTSDFSDRRRRKRWIFPSSLYCRNTAPYSR